MRRPVFSYPNIRFAWVVLAALAAGGNVFGQKAADVQVVRAQPPTTWKNVAPDVRYEAGVPRPSAVILRAQALHKAVKTALTGCRASNCERPALDVLTASVEAGPAAAGAVVSCPGCVSVGSSVAVATTRGVGSVTKTEVLRVVAGFTHPRVVSVTGRTGARLSAAETAFGEDVMVKAVTGAGERATLGRTAAEALVEGARGGARSKALVPEAAPTNPVERFFRARR